MGSNLRLIAALVGIVLLGGCTTTSALEKDRQDASRVVVVTGTGAAPSNGVGNDASEGTGGNSGSGTCHSDASTRLVCDASKANGAPHGDAVVLHHGAGLSPSPEGGPVLSGDYQLVAVTLYGSWQPNTTLPNVGDRVQSVLHVDCDIANELYVNNLSMGAASGNGCWRLEPHALSLLSQSGFFVASGPPIPDERDRVSYTANGPELSLIFTYPYVDLAHVAILGASVYVQDFMHVSGLGMKLPVTRETDDGVQAEPPSRDPRCPASPPSNGDPCSTDPAPLECEYGGDAWGACSTFAVCTLGLDGMFRFQLREPSECTPPNPSECPATFAAATAVAKRLHDANDVSPPFGPDGGMGIDTTCHYAEGACGCMLTGGIRIRPACEWGCRAGAGTGDGGLPAGCPWPRPLAGDPCPPGLECDYEMPCGAGTSLGPSLICQNGYWAQLGGISFGCGP